ncbi:fungal-specific transcription factor domain-containing protein [Hypomontagnella submonticulosa]|nr:fungal-specific transcription factor domain-containing protein [Hypomontagnella submonticulosa]
MFTTFVGTSAANSPRSSRSAESVINSVSPDGPQQPRPRQKRSQVTRACDWCRVHRIKCDNNHPCLNCQNRGGQCSNDRTGQVRTLPHAFREIERLKKRNQELQKELEEERNRSRNQAIAAAGASNPQLLTPPSTSSVPPTAAIAAPSGLSLDDGGSSKKYWEGIYTSTARSGAKTWYGPASLLYFISRLNAFLASTLQHHVPENYMQPNSASRLLDGPTSPHSEKLADERGHAPLDDPLKAKEYLTPTQEEYFLDFYWQSYHTSMLVLDEDDFRQHYKSLWAGSGKSRKPSALVDIVIALCMQYGMARGRGNRGSSVRSADVDTNDATLAGRWHYCRCQNLLACELESPTISTLQCNILSVIWLCCASFQNMADSTLALTARTAQMLGLHLPPPQDMPIREKEMRRRLWWSIYVLETKTSMKLGRPFVLHLSQVNCGLPGDDHEVATQSGSNFAPLGEHTTWLSWNLHNTKLVLAVRDVYTAFYEKYPDFFDGDSHQTIYEAQAAMETYAEFLLTHMRKLENWVKDVPDALKTKRKDHGTPLSTDRSSLDIEQFAPLWVQRQRLLLELLYHNLCTNLYRPFISFKSDPSAAPASFPQSSSLAESCAHSCASHAMTFTHVMRQVLSTTDILTGWQEAFQWQWNCAMTLVGFVLAYPHGEMAQAARDAIHASIDALSIFGNSFAVAASAANLVRTLSETVDNVVASQPENRPLTLDEGHKLMAQEDQAMSISQGEQPVVSMGQADLAFPDLDEETVATMQDILAGSMDMAFAIDGYNGNSILWPSIDLIG